MPEYIEREALKEEIEYLRITITGLRAGKGVLTEFAYQYRNSILKAIDEQATVDAVAVVRCKDCKCNSGEQGNYVECNYWLDIVKPNGFCSYGERRGEDV